VKIPALTTQQMIEVDRLMIEDYGIDLIQMMENAGRQLAEQARRMLGRLSNRPIVVLCGAGNNGGGGLVAARHLHNRGAQVHVKLVGDADRLKPVPAHQYRILHVMGLITGDEPNLTQADLIIDALIGYGLIGQPRGPIAEWIDRANVARRPILALDAPSGLNASTGAASSHSIRATATLTLALPKIGLLTPPAKAWVGELYLADISVPPELYARPSLGLTVGPIFADDSIVRVE
jgi:NAD(P)H-hydrate epimerase